MSDFDTDWKPTTQFKEQEDIRQIVQAWESKAPYTHTLQVIRAGAKRAESQGTLRTHTRLQAISVKYLSLIWSGISKEDQSLEIQFWTRNLQRCIDTPDGKTARNLFLDLLSLNTDAEIRRALAVKASAFTVFDPDPGDEIYLEAQGWLRGYLLWCRNTAVPLPWHFWSGVTILGAMCKRRLWHRRGPEDFYMNWYTVLSGDRGSGKSVARELAMDILNRCNDAIALESGNPNHPAILFSFGGDTTSQGFIKELGERHRIEEDDDGKRRARQDCCSILDIDELATFLGKDTYTPVSRLAAIVELKNKKRYPKTLANKTFVLNNVVTSILACCAPSWMRGAIDPNIQQGGVLDRTLFVYRRPTRREFPTAPAIDPIFAQELAFSLKDTVQYRMKGMGEPFVDTTMAGHWYNKWYSAQAKKYQSGASDGYSLHRKGENLTRLASLLALSKNTLTVEVEDYQLAREIFDREIKEQVIFHRIVNEKPIDTDLRSIAEYIKNKKGCQSKSELLNRFTKTFGSRDKAYQRLMDGVQKGLWIEVPAKIQGSLFRLPRHKCKRCRAGEERGEVVELSLVRGKDE